MTNPLCEFVKAIAGVEREKVKDKLEQAKFITVLSYGSTDIGAIEKEIVYVRYSVKCRKHLFTYSPLTSVNSLSLITKQASPFQL